jgi:hypothetical protein
MMSVVRAPTERQRSSMRGLSRLSLVVTMLVCVGCATQVRSTFEFVGTASPSFGASASAAPSITWVRYDSPRNGYSIELPSDWTVKSATANWQPGALLTEEDPAADRMDGPGHLVFAGSQPLPSGSDAESWIQGIWDLRAAAQGPELPCQNQLEDWVEVSVGDTTGLMDTKCEGLVLFVLVAAGDRGYTFVDNSGDRDLFEQMLSTVELTPETAIQ